MSDGTDPAAAPMQYTILKNTLSENPLHFFYGAVPTTQYNYPEGMAVWFTWIEKIALTAVDGFFPVEQLFTWVGFILMLLTALAMYGLGRYLGWSRTLSFASGIAYAFTAYTRARAKVHNSLTGLFHLPLIFLALEILMKRKDRKSFILASMLLVLATMVAQYYTILTGFFSPFFIWYFFSDEKIRKNWKPELKRLVLSTVPAILFIVYTIVFSVPSEFKEKAVVTPMTGVSEAWPHPFMMRFAAHPIDYLTGDVAIGEHDLNPLRGALTSYVQKNLGDSNPHERTNGIRWLVILVAIFAFIASFRKSSSPLPEELRRRLFILGIMGFAAFLMSLSPIWFGLPIGPSGLVHLLVSQFRVPSRTGIVTSFAFVFMTGLYLSWILQNKEFKLKKWLLIPGILPFLAMAELPPAWNEMPTARLMPPYQALQQRADCGPGLYYPYVSNSWSLNEFYYFLQRLRGTTCKSLNANAASPRDSLFLKAAPLHPQVLAAITSGDPGFQKQTIELFRCMGLDWYVFDPRVPAAWRETVCSSIGYKMTEDNLCLSPQPHPTLARLPEQCLR